MFLANIILLKFIDTQTTVVCAHKNAISNNGLKTQQSATL